MNSPQLPLPLHQAVRMTDCGVFLKRIMPEPGSAPVRYAHRDDYYLFGLVEEGTCRIGLDFQEHLLHAGEMLCIRPGQVHRLVDDRAVRASVLFVDEAFVDARDKRTLTEFAFLPRPFRLEHSLRGELEALYAMIDRWTPHAGTPADVESDKRIVQQLARAVVGMVSRVLRNDRLQRPGMNRYVELSLALRELLDREKLIPGGPAQYAAALHVSPGYLNEAVRAVTGESVGKYIRNEQIIRAKRLLMNTSMQVREIALELGVDDAAYFTRLFTRETGESPSQFRRQYLE